MVNIISIQSHVVFGHAGNSAAVFPMRRMGADVWPLNTVQFSNHTQYGKWKGEVFGPDMITDICEGISDIGQLIKCDAILSGYIGSAEQGEKILEIVEAIKAKNPNAIYFCDPVMGSPTKGCVLAKGVAEFLCANAIPAADMIAPNLYELEKLTGREINNFDEALSAARLALQMGPKMLLVKHLDRASKDLASYETLLVTADEAWHISRPLHQFDRPPIGVGDLTSGLMLVNLQQGKSYKEALEHVTAAVDEVMRVTKQLDQYELQVVAAQDRIVTPSVHYDAVAV
ncbi:pyridoxal kinase PdxY (plasmid) [Photobacterium sp. DA100]|uniref:pyridoxal kinase PdxY n=1 Tax=Photobacterium sp. DA100 TaxID=3027472 RepID=UPI002478729A|nr:pyridoxal kinase PdxY [Photobacterium sp. DA100]WEM44694.1 pyridoxal kinase PdxY [Photobacterium sp. DA100]